MIVKLNHPSRSIHVQQLCEKFQVDHSVEDSAHFLRSPPDL